MWFFSYILRIFYFYIKPSFMFFISWTLFSLIELYICKTDSNSHGWKVNLLKDLLKIIEVYVLRGGLESRVGNINSEHFNVTNYALRKCKYKNDFKLLRVM